MESSARRHLAVELMKALDLVILAAGWVMANSILANRGMALSWHALLSTNIPVGNLLALTCLLIAWHVMFRFMGVYQSHRFASLTVTLLAIVKASTAGVLALCLLSLLLPWQSAAVFFLILWALVVPMELLAHFTVRLAQFCLRRRGRNIRALLIVGTDGRAEEFASRVERRPGLGYRIVGFVRLGGEESRLHDHQIVCEIDGLARFLRENIVDEVAVCLTKPGYYEGVLTVARICEEQGIMLRIHADLFNNKLRVTRMDQFEGDHLLTVASDDVPAWASLAKRSFDVIGSFILLVVLAPVFLAAAVAVKYSSPGPVFFTQVRLGKNKRRFRLYKLRTMVVDAEQQLAGLETLNEAQGPVFKMRCDPRITSAGHLLRKLSIDELPQLLNVLAGDMSLVGPRPLPIRDYSGFSENWHLRRFSVRPGISCLWQISGRSEIGFNEWMELDMKYIDQWSLWLDMKILAKTIPAVVRGAGAY